jgi:subtilase family serine protease
MSIDRILRFSRLGFWLLLLAIGSPSAPAAQAHHKMSPWSVIGPKAIPAIDPGPPGLFTCQVGMAPYVCYDPYQMRHAYQIDSLIHAGYTGAGRTIVIVDAFQSPTLVHDLANFDSVFHLPPISLTQIAPDGLTPWDPNNFAMGGWALEMTLDAPGARIVLVLAKSDQDADILSALKYAVDQNLGDVVSMSFGESEICMDSDLLSEYHEVFAAAARKNITMIASSGDIGASVTCDFVSFKPGVNFPASDPLVMAVGGTELHATGYCLAEFGCDPATHPLPGTYDGEIAWSEFGFESSGGGFSVLFDQPRYQKSAIKHAEGRGVPDVAYNAAAFHGVIISVFGEFHLDGGTSAGSPQWAGIVAIADQKAGHRLGFLNSAIYQIGKGKKAYPASFHDITSGNNFFLDFDPNGNPIVVDAFDAAPGWDPPTGVGTPMATSLVDYLISYVSPGDALAEDGTKKPHPDKKPKVPGHMKPH